MVSSLNFLLTSIIPQSTNRAIAKKKMMHKGNNKGNRNANVGAEQ